MTREPRRKLGVLSSSTLNILPNTTGRQRSSNSCSYNQGHSSHKDDDGDDEGQMNRYKNETHFKDHHHRNHAHESHQNKTSKSRPSFMKSLMAIQSLSPSHKASASQQQKRQMQQLHSATSSSSAHTTQSPRKTRRDGNNDQGWNIVDVDDYTPSHQDDNNNDNDNHMKTRVPQHSTTTKTTPTKPSSTSSSPAKALGDIYQGCLLVWNQHKKKGGIPSCVSPRSCHKNGDKKNSDSSSSSSTTSSVCLNINTLHEQDKEVLLQEKDLKSSQLKTTVVKNGSTDKYTGHKTHNRDMNSHDKNESPQKGVLARESHPPFHSSHLRQKSSHNSCIPGIFFLMDQNQWQRVQKRALKYPKECRKSAVLSSKSSSSSSSLLPGVERSEFDSHIHGLDKDKNHVHKCKALHHACHRLRRVHGYIRKCIAEAILRGYNGDEMEGSFHEKSESDWEDPWVEACKAILVILQQYPEAAKMRETKHGCLPIHLAAFAMCPTPTVEEVETRYMSLERVDAGSGNSNRDGEKFSSWTDVAPPRPSNLRRRLSHSSADDSVGGGAGENSYGGQSLDGWSANMDHEREGGSLLHDSGNSWEDRRLEGHASQASSSFDLALEKLESQLRSRPDTKLSPLDEANLLESARLLSAKDVTGGINSGGYNSLNAGISRKGIPKPSSLHSIMTTDSSGGRSFSVGSYTSSCSVSVMSAASSVHTTAAVSKGNTFNLKRYISNQEKREEYSLKVLHALLDAYPKGVRVDSEGGRLPLHTAVAGKASLTIIETLAKAYPYACRHRNMENSLPLHLAACYGVSDPAVAPMLLRLYPYACVGRNRWERTPLEEALLKGGENGRDHQEALCRALRKPPEYWVGGFFGETTTYKELQHNFDTRDKIALDNEISGNYRHEEFAKDPSEVKPVDTDLFSLIKERQWDIIVKHIDSLKEQANKLAKREVRGGQIAMVSALYYACELDPTYNVLDALVKACPGATTWRKQPGGQLPLHALCTWGGSKEAIGFLLAACPESSKRRDDTGNLALHAACYSGASEAIIQSLLLCDPKAVHVTNVQGSTPRDIVCQLYHKNRKKVLNLIEDVSLELLEKKRSYEKKKLMDQKINSEIDKVLEVKSNSIKGKSLKKSFFRFSKKEKKKDSFSGASQQMPLEPKMNITGSPPPEENIEVSLEEESFNDLLWV